MIAVVKQSATEEQISHLIRWIEKRGCKTDVSRGASDTIVGIIGDTTRIDPFLLESMSIIERVQTVTEPFKMANRKFHPQDTVIDCGHGIQIGGDNFQVMAGPSSVEGDNIFEIARIAKEAGATILRGNAFKASNSPYAFQGLGFKGVELLVAAGIENQMPVVTEILDVRQVEDFVEKGVSIIQVGSKNALNFALLKELGKTDTPILLKRNPGSTIDEFLLAAEYVMSEGNDQVILCERGIRTYEDRVRVSFDVNIVSVLKDLTHLPVVVDAANAVGYTDYVSPCAYAATVAGANGLMLEVHPDRANAREHGGQALSPLAYKDTMDRIRRIRELIAD